MASYSTCKEVSPQCPISATTYGYRPNAGGNIFFTVFFGVLGVCQVGYGVYFRSWTFLVALGVGTFMEVAGYIGRLLLWKNPWNEDGFKLQIVCLVLAPTFVAAGVYLSLKHIILYLGPEHSRLKPKLFTWIFIGCDVGSLILQAAGGGVAASAGHSNQDLLDVGDNIIIAGIAFQVATMACCGILGLDFFISVLRRGRDSMREKAYGTGRGIKFMIIAEIIAYFFVLIRCIYRIPEMSGGWGGPLMQRENEFLALDGMMIAVACLAFTVCHPAVFFPTMRTGFKPRHHDTEHEEIEH
ncbi:RTA1 domain protein [Aspergillus sclerotialis]|uniref:RTA1 domain protein n=1 Tax=Aspergillus sclerotialis TaxID=2070753 RepID=A0A3A2ZU77_9EURO|nr:RTA1 domain protein [Aspergillus sclerotialis]